MIKVVHGANAQDVALEGQTVAQAKQNLKDVLNIPDDAVAMISGNNVETDYVLREGDTLEFVKQSGTKG